MSPTDLADRYFANVRARDIDAWLALFAEDATYVLPDGRRFCGLAAIREFQLGVFTAGAPFPTAGAKVVGETSIAVEIEARLPDGTVRQTANFFHLNAAGQIQRLSIYRRG
jgi:ketosteroid isomerase-like protein